MKTLIVLGSILLPMLMLYVEFRKPSIRNIYNIIFVISSLIFGNIAALAIYQVIIDQTVFMTAIHGVFLKPMFLITGAILGIDTIYRLYP